MSGSDFTLYYNPRCSKSRAARELLAAHGVAVAERDYLRDPPGPVELRALLDALGLPARALLRFDDAAAAARGLTPEDSRSEREWIELLAAHPILMQRPILQRGRRAVIARPPERVLELL
jgi:arsenate reductase